MSRIKVLLVDDQSIILDGLVALLHDDKDMEVVGMACNGAEAVACVEQLLPNVVVMDISMPVMDGIEATRLITKGFPKCHVLVLSMYHLQDVIDDAFDAGAMGYILKNTTQAQFREAIRTVAKGQRFIAPEVQKELDEMAQSGANGTAPPASALLRGKAAQRRERALASILRLKPMQPLRRQSPLKTSTSPPTAARLPSTLIAKRSRSRAEQALQRLQLAISSRSTAWTVRSYTTISAGSWMTSTLRTPASP